MRRNLLILKIILVCTTVTLETQTWAALFARDGQVIADEAVMSDKVDWRHPTIRASGGAPGGQEAANINAVANTFLDGYVDGKGISYDGSGTLIHPGGIINDTQPAYLLTAGHVVRPPLLHPRYLEGDLYGVTLGSEEFPEFAQLTLRVVFNNFNDAREEDYVIASGRKIIFATMQGVDVAIVELDIPLKKLIDSGINPRPIATKLPGEGQPIQSLGIPIALNVITQASTTYETPMKTVSIGKFSWSMIRQLNSSMIEGMSGGPVMNEKHEIIGINTIGGKNTNYFQSVIPFYEAFGSDGVISFQKVQFIFKTMYTHQFSTSAYDR